MPTDDPNRYYVNHIGATQKNLHEQLLRNRTDSANRQGAVHRMAAAVSSAWTSNAIGRRECPQSPFALEQWTFASRLRNYNQVEITTVRFKILATQRFPVAV